LQVADLRSTSDGTSLGHQELGRLVERPWNPLVSSDQKASLFGVLVLGLIARIYSQITLLLFFRKDIDRRFAEYPCE